MRQFLGFVRSRSSATRPASPTSPGSTCKTFRGFLAARRRSGAVSRSLARSLSALRQLFRWLEAQKLVENRAILQLAMPKVPHSASPSR